MKKLLLLLSLISISVSAKELTCNTSEVELLLNYVYGEDTHIVKSNIVVLYKKSVICKTVISTNHRLRTIDYELDYRNDDESYIKLIKD
jgi:hypothetical protein